MKKESKEIFLAVDGITPEYEEGPVYCGNLLRGIWVYIGGTAHYFKCDKYAVCDPDVAREDGYRQAFDLVKEIIEMTGSERKQAFDEILLTDIISHATYDDLVKKLDAWKKEKETIHVKDEVENKVYHEVSVVLDIRDGNIYSVTKNKRFISDAPINKFKKTGVHVDDLDAYLGM